MTSKPTGDNPAQPSHNQPAVVVCGSINVDTFVHVDRFPQPGETTIGQRGIEGLGGKGANQAVASARSGAPTYLISAVGDDPQGQLARSELADYGVHTDTVDTVDQPTGQAFIMNDPSGENIIIVTSGANTTVSPQRAIDTYAESLPNTAVVLAQGELTAKHTEELPALAEHLGARLIVNLAPVTTHDSTLVAAADPLILNEGEAADLLHVPFDTPLDEILAGLRTMTRSAVVTLGPRGAVIVSDGEPQLLPAIPVDDVVDTTGAGDAFAGTLAAALAQGESLDAAARLAIAAGSLAIQKPGAAASYATGEEIRELATTSGSTGSPNEKH